MNCREKVLPLVDCSVSTQEAFEAVRLYLYDCFDQSFDDDLIIRFLALNFLVFGTNCEYLPGSDK